MKRWVSCLVLTCAAGCGLNIGRPATPPTVTAELAPVETAPAVAPFAPVVETLVPPFHTDPIAPFLLTPGLLQDVGRADDILGVLLDALLVDLLTPVGPRLNDSMTFLERLCLEGDNPDSFCRRRYGR